MTLALKAIDVAPAPQPYKLSSRELKLREYFIAAFTDVEKPVWALRAAVWNVTDELKKAGESPEVVIKRIKYIAAIPISFHYRVGYEAGHSRLLEVTAKATSFCISRYFDDEEG